jgi:hypothetical protein
VTVDRLLTRRVELPSQDTSIWQNTTVDCGYALECVLKLCGWVHPCLDPAAVVMTSTKAPFHPILTRLDAHVPDKLENSTANMKQS